MSSADPSATSPLLHDSSASALVLSATPPEDPPPPYPSARRTRQNRRRRALQDNNTDLSHVQSPSDEYDAPPPAHTHPHPFPDAPDDVDPSETTPLLAPNPVGSPRPGLLLGTIQRRRTLSLTSTLRSQVSLAPSFAQTVFSAFQPARDSDLDPDCREDGGQDVDHDELEPELDSPIVRDYDPQQRAFAADLSGYTSRHSQRQQPIPFGTRCRRYFRPLRRRAYYSALFHILVINFPYALFSWIFLFVFTLVGTCTLMALPLGAVFCFIDLFGARVLARGELSLQSTFHGPLAYPLPHPPLPIFTRMRAPTAAQLEAGAGAGANALVPETSFYRNAYAMFTDSTSYQALFYFLVIKPGITLLMSVFFVVVVPVAAVLVVPLPAALRLARRVGIWQANVAVEGLYFAAR